MARKDEMLKAFLKNEEFCSKYNKIGRAHV